MLRNTSNSYGIVAMTFHWVMALLIVATLILGLVMVRLSPFAPETFTLYQLHKSIGFVLLCLVILRLLWRFTQPVPELPKHMPVAERIAASAVHVFLYFFMFALPLTGWLVVSSAAFNVPTVVFGILPIPHLPLETIGLSKANVEPLVKELHEYGGWAIIAFLVFHVIGALKHHFWDKDDVLRRMLRSLPRNQSRSG